jgi:hypothetical protein
MKKIKSLALVVIMITLYSCMQTVIWDEGEEAIRTVWTVNYDTIEFRGIFNVLLVQDTTDFVKIFCGENLINHVRTHQTKRYIEISETSEMNWTRSYKRTMVEMHFTQISQIYIHEGISIKSLSPVKSPFLSIRDNSGVSDIDIEIDCSGFALWVSQDNFGVYKISGTAGYTCLEPDGSAHFRTENLVTDSCYVNHLGIGDCYVNAKSILKGSITGKGRLFYKNNPTLRVNIENNAGKIIPF